MGGHTHLLSHYEPNVSLANYAFLFFLYVALGNSTEAVSWLTDRGLIPTFEAMNVAVVQNKLEMVKLMRKKGCVWNEDTMVCAAKSGKTEIFQYLWDKGCPYNREEVFRTADNRGFENILQFILEREGEDTSEFNPDKPCDFEYLRTKFKPRIGERLKPVRFVDEFLKIHPSHQTFLETCGHLPIPSLLNIFEETGLYGECLSGTYSLNSEWIPFAYASHDKRQDHLYAVHAVTGRAAEWTSSPLVRTMTKAKETFASLQDLVEFLWPREERNEVKEMLGEDHNEHSGTDEKKRKHEESEEDEENRRHKIRKLN